MGINQFVISLEFVKSISKKMINIIKRNISIPYLSIICQTYYLKDDEYNYNGILFSNGLNIFIVP